MSLLFFFLSQMLFISSVVSLGEEPCDVEDLVRSSIAQVTESRRMVCDRPGGNIRKTCPAWGARRPMAEVTIFPLRSTNNNVSCAFR